MSPFMPGLVLHQYLLHLCFIFASSPGWLACSILFILACRWLIMMLKPRHCVNHAALRWSCMYTKSRWLPTFASISRTNTHNHKHIKANMLPLLDQAYCRTWCAHPSPDTQEVPKQITRRHRAFQHVPEERHRDKKRPQRQSHAISNDITGKGPFAKNPPLRRTN